MWCHLGRLIAFVFFASRALSLATFSLALATLSKEHFLIDKKDNDVFDPLSVKRTFLNGRKKYTLTEPTSLAVSTSKLETRAAG